MAVFGVPYSIEAHVIVSRTNFLLAYLCIAVFVEIYFALLDGSKYQLVGCFKDDTRRMHQLLITERDHTSHAWNGMWIDWNNWDSYMAAFIDRCAVKAKAMNYRVFGMSYYGK